MKNKKKIIAIGIGTGVLGVALLLFLFSSKEKQKDIVLENPSGTIVTEENNEDETTRFEYKSDDSNGMAKETLETNVLIKDDKEVKEQVELALKNLYSAEGTTPANNYGITTEKMIESLKMAKNFSYDYDMSTFQAFESDSENVIQFIVDMVRTSDGETVTMTGNYVTGTKQVQFSTIQGGFTVQSQSDEKQSAD